MNEINTCKTCKTEYETMPEICSNCGFPFKGTDKEKSHFVAHQILKKNIIKTTKESIKKARTVLFLIGGFNILIPLFKYLNGQYDGIMLFLSIIIGLIFLLFGFTAKYKPFISILIPLSLLSIFYLLITIIDPTTLFNGIIWKFIFLGSMIYSLNSIIKSEKIKKESIHLSTKDYK